MVEDLDIHNEHETVFETWHTTFKCRCDLFIIREYDRTLYVGLARAVSPTNTIFRLTFLLTRLQEALYEDLAV